MGRAIAERLAASGHRIVLMARRCDELASALRGIRDTGGYGDLVVGDASVPAAATEAVQVASRDSRLSALINCVGMNLPRRSLRELTSSAWREMVRVNLDSAYELTRAVLPVFREQQNGLLVHLASRSVLEPDGSGASYQAAKAGVTALAHATAAEEQANGIRVSVIYPGFTDTPLVHQRPAPPTADELKRALQPDDVAKVVELLVDLPSRAHIPDISIFPTH